jgi:hypothetical protein
MTFWKHIKEGIKPLKYWQKSSAIIAKKLNSYGLRVYNITLDRVLVFLQLSSVKLYVKCCFSSTFLLLMHRKHTNMTSSVTVWIEKRIQSINFKYIHYLLTELKYKDHYQVDNHLIQRGRKWVIILFLIDK